MKRLLALLMCLVFLQAQTFALRGGPSSRNGIEQVNGYYSGVLSEIGGTDIGLFLLTGNTSGASNGQIVFFSSNDDDVNTYAGTITGLSNPNSGQLLGVFGATDVNNTTGSQSISGQLTATAIRSNVISGNSTQQLFGTASARTLSITGTGVLVGITRNISPLKNYFVSGWQSNGEGVGFALFGG